MEVSLLQLRAELFRLAEMICKDPDMAEDIVQDTYLQALIGNIVLKEKLISLCKLIALEKLEAENLNAAKAQVGDSSIESQLYHDFMVNSIRDPVTEVPDLKDLMGEIKKEEGRTRLVSFENAGTYARTLGLRTLSEWKILHDTGQMPANLPKSPADSYAAQWQGWKDFIGWDWMLFADARQFVIDQLVPIGIDNYRNYIAYGKAGNLPKQIPVWAEHIYRQEWKGWKYWFGTGNARDLPMKSYEEAKWFVQHYMVPVGIDTCSKYYKLVDPPDGLPKDVCSYFRNRGWIHSSDFFGTQKEKIGTVKNYRDYKTVREWSRLHLRGHGIKGRKSFQEYLKGMYPDAPPWPADFPRNPCNYYTIQKQWVSYTDMLGVPLRTRQKNRFWSFEKAREWTIAHLGHIEDFTRHTWELYAREVLPLYDLPELPFQMPLSPESTYRQTGQWRGWAHFLNRQSRQGIGLKLWVEKMQAAKKRKRQDQREADMHRIILNRRGVFFRQSNIILTAKISGKQLQKLLRNKHIPRVAGRK